MLVCVVHRIQFIFVWASIQFRIGWSSRNKLKNEKLSFKMAESIFFCSIRSTKENEIGTCIVKIGATIAYILSFVTSLICVCILFSVLLSKWLKLCVFILMYKCIWLSLFVTCVVCAMSNEQKICYMEYIHIFIHQKY